MKFYSDEAKVQIGVGGGYERVWQKPGTELQDRYLQATFKEERVSTMFWGAISHSGGASLFTFVKSPQKSIDAQMTRVGWIQSNTVRWY